LKLWNKIILTITRFCHIYKRFASSCDKCNIHIHKFSVSSSLDESSLCFIELHNYVRNVIDVLSEMMARNSNASDVEADYVIR